MAEHGPQPHCPSRFSLRPAKLSDQAEVDVQHIAGREMSNQMFSVSFELVADLGVEFCCTCFESPLGRRCMNLLPAKRCIEITSEPMDGVPFRHD